MVQMTMDDSLPVFWQEPTVIPSTPGENIVYSYYGIVDGNAYHDPSMGSGSAFSVSKSPYIVAYYWLENLENPASASCIFSISVQQEQGIVDFLMFQLGKMGFNYALFNLQ